MVSFTFDDGLISACTTGRDVVERYGARATYYLCGGFAGGSERIDFFEPYIDRRDASELLARGHEIGCHTYSHARVDHLGFLAIRGELRRNRKWMAEIAGDYGCRSFAYPEGVVSEAAKFHLRHRFASCRGTRDGLNLDNTDLADLRANKIYSHRDNIGRLEELVEENARRGGWLIFYTHDVRDRPSRFGCTPDELARLMAAARAAGSAIAPVDEALRLLEARRG